MLVKKCYLVISLKKCPIVLVYLWWSRQQMTARGHQLFKFRIVKGFMKNYARWPSNALIWNCFPRFIYKWLLTSFWERMPLGQKGNPFRSFSGHSQTNKNKNSKNEPINRFLWIYLQLWIHGIKDSSCFYIGIFNFPFGVY